MPISRQVRATRMAISPRLAMRTLRMATLRSSREARNLSRARRGGQPAGAIRRRACSEVRAAALVSHVAREAPRTPPRGSLHSYTPVLLLPFPTHSRSRGEAMEFDRQDLSWKARHDRLAPSRGAGRL